MLLLQIMSENRLENIKHYRAHLSTQVEEGGVEYSIAQFYLSNCLEDYIELAYFNLECVYLNGPKLSIVWLEKNELYAINYPRKYLLEKTRCE